MLLSMLQKTLALFRDSSVISVIITVISISGQKYRLLSHCKKNLFVNCIQKLQFTFVKLFFLGTHWCKYLPVEVIKEPIKYPFLCNTPSLGLEDFFHYQLRNDCFITQKEGRRYNLCHNGPVTDASIIDVDFSPEPPAGPLSRVVVRRNCQHSLEKN